MDRRHLDSCELLAAIVSGVGLAAGWQVRTFRTLQQAHRRALSVP
jgi:hypothetical protein